MCTLGRYRVVTWVGQDSAALSPLLVDLNQNEIAVTGTLKDHSFGEGIVCSKARCLARLSAARSRSPSTAATFLTLLPSSPAFRFRMVLHLTRLRTVIPPSLSVDVSDALRGSKSTASTSPTKPWAPPPRIFPKALSRNSRLPLHRSTCPRS